MRLTNYIRLQRRVPLWATVASTAVLITSVRAQNDDNSPSPAESSGGNPDDEASQTQSGGEEPLSTSNPPPESTTNNNDEESSSTDPAESSSPTDEASSSTSSEDVSTTDAPDPSTTSNNDDDGLISNPPTLTMGYGIPTYPAAAIPPTENAPFMQHSRAPDGTVFIAVGAILGAFLLAILLWRLIVSLLLHRSVKRAAMAQHDANSKAGFPAPPAQFYKYTDQGSTMSLGAAAAAGRGVRRTTRGPIPSSTPSASNLFFSPTAATSNNAGNRGSTFLPSGFYAAAGGAPPPPNGSNHGHSISLTNLRPDSRGHAANGSRHTLNQTPPESPAFPARRDISASSLNLNRPSSQRAPSAYLDDLLADDPGALPPPHMPPQSGRNSPQVGRNSPHLPPGSNRI